MSVFVCWLVGWLVSRITQKLLNGSLQTPDFNIPRQNLCLWKPIWQWTFVLLIHSMRGHSQAHFKLNHLLSDNSQVQALKKIKSCLCPVFGVSMILYLTPQLFNGRIQMSDSLTGHLDTPLSSYSSPLMSHYPSPHLASTKSQGLRSMLGSTTSHNHRQQSQYPATTRRVSPDIYAAIGDIMRVLVKDETGDSVIFLKRWPETITLGAWLFWPFFTCSLAALYNAREAWRRRKNWKGKERMKKKMKS